MGIWGSLSSFLLLCMFEFLQNKLKMVSREDAPVSMLFTITITDTKQIITSELFTMR